MSVGSADITSSSGAVAAGGLIGFAVPGATVTGSHASGTVTGGDFSAVGGLVGFTYASISQSYATGAVSGGVATDAGGLVGLTYAAIANSDATGNVTVGSGINSQNSGPIPASYAGGLAGVAFSSSATVTNSYATGSVLAGDFSDAGGLVGWAVADVTGSHGHRQRYRRQ